MINSKAVGDSRYARTGKDGAFYDENGQLMATVDTFTAQVSFNNAAYSVLGCPLELESVNTHKITLTFSQLVIEDDRFVDLLSEFFNSAKTPILTFQGVVKGDNNSEERYIYKNCIPSGQVDIQNVTTGDVLKRAWSFAVNAEPKLQKKLTTA